MERINQYAFVEIGKSLQKLEGRESMVDVPAAAIHLDILEARGFVSRLLAGDPVPLGVSRAKAEEVERNLTTIIDMHFTSTDANGVGTFKYPDAADPPVPGWRLYFLNKALDAFETVFREEMREAATYFVPRRGIFHTPALVDFADESFPADLLSQIPQKTRDDWKAAGRCLAFNLLSASGFHVARAVEGTLEAYYQLFSGKQGETLRSWDDYIKALQKIADKKPDPCPEDKTLTELDQMRTDYRNPIVHPRVVLSEADARMLFSNGESLIIAMAQEITKIRDRGGVQPMLVSQSGKTLGEILETAASNPA